MIHPRAPGCNSRIHAKSEHRIDQATVNAILADFDRTFHTINHAMYVAPIVSFGLSVRGRYLYLKGNFSGAVSDLQIANKITNWPEDMILLYLARERNGENATAELVANSARLRTRDWPYPVIGLLLGQKTFAETQIAGSRAGKKCEASFYAAQWNSIRGNKTGATTVFRPALDACPKESDEYKYAITEILRLNTSP